MTIEKTKNEIIIKLPAGIDTTGLQSFVDYLCYKEATSKSVAKQSDIDTLSRDVKKSWWNTNKSRLLE
jgi:hypothetical protein